MKQRKQRGGSHLGWGLRGIWLFLLINDVFLSLPNHREGSSQASSWGQRSKSNLLLSVHLQAHDSKGMGLRLLSLFYQITCALRLCGLWQESKGWLTSAASHQSLFNNLSTLRCWDSFITKQYVIPPSCFIHSCLNRVSGLRSMIIPGH